MKNSTPHIYSTEMQRIKSTNHTISIMQSLCSGFFLNKIYKDKLEQIFNEKKIILSSGKFSARAFIINGNKGVVGDELAQEIKNTLLSMELDLGQKVQMLQEDLEELTTIQSHINASSRANYQKVTYTNTVMGDLRNQIFQLNKMNKDLQKKANKTEGIVAERPKIPVTPSQALTWS